jgi:AcrR family transcriptional regulator
MHPPCGGFSASPGEQHDQLPAVPRPVDGHPRGRRRGRDIELLVQLPNRVDHEKRRQIVGAPLRSAAGRGLHAAGMRDVAAKADLSLRMVQYYFGTNEELLLFAAQRIEETETLALIDLGTNQDHALARMRSLGIIAPYRDLDRPGSATWLMLHRLGIPRFWGMRPLTLLLAFAPLIAFSVLPSLPDIDIEGSKLDEREVQPT